jgi:hypothetical protein
MTSHDQTGSSLSSKLNSLVAASSSAPCRIGEIHAQLDKETGDALIRALQSPATTMSIHRAIREEGFSLSRGTLTDHRKCFQSPSDADCKCFPNNTGA